MKQYKVGILGATGSVGREMMKILLEREFPISELHLYASERSAGKVVAWNGGPIQIELAAEDAFEGLDIVLGAAESEVAKQFAPAIVKAGAVFIDNSSAFRLREDVPLVVPEVNPEDVKLHRGIIANPNCSTIIAVTAVNALRQLSPIVSIVASLSQAGLGGGRQGVRPPAAAAVLGALAEVAGLKGGDLDHDLPPLYLVLPWNYTTVHAESQGFQRNYPGSRRTPRKRGRQVSVSISR